MAAALGGLPDVRLLDGGLAAWVTAGGALDAGDVVARAGRLVLTGGELPTLDLDAVGSGSPTACCSTPARASATAARSSRSTRGPATSPARSAHRPPTTSLPTAVPGADALRERFAALGVADGTVGVYCGSGVTAAHEIAALAVAGFDAALYAGSWSQWSNHDELPVATGK